MPKYQEYRIFAQISFQINFKQNGATVEAARQAAIDKIKEVFNLKDDERYMLDAEEVDIDVETMDTEDPNFCSECGKPLIGDKRCNECFTDNEAQDKHIHDTTHKDNKFVDIRDEPWLCNVCGTNTVSNKGDMCAACTGFEPLEGYDPNDDWK